MNETPPPRGFRFEEPRQARIFERLRRLIGEGPAQFFRDSCRARSLKPPMDSGSHLVAHGLRETESALRQVLEPFEDGTPVPKNTKKAHEQSIRKVCRGLLVPEEDQLVAAWLSFTGEENPDGLHRRAHRDDLRSTRPMDAAFQGWCERVLTVFDVVLEKAEASYSVVFRALDALLTKAGPETDDVDWFRRRVPSTPLTHGYFFERLEHAGWLEPLARVGVLTLVPPLDRDDEAGTIGFPPWPAKPYLLRMARIEAREVQEVVLRILLTLPETDNTRVHADVAEIGTILPADLAAQLTGFVDRGLREPYHLLLPHQAAPFIVHLAQSGFLEEATGLSKTLFEVLPDTAPPRQIGNTTNSPTPRARMQDVFYGHELAKVAPALVAANPCAAANTFAQLLAQVLQLSQREGGNGRHAHSHVWRPTIGGVARGHDEPRDHLLNALLSALDACVAKNPARLRDLVLMLEAYGWLVFKRIALHLLASNDAPVDLADAMATDLDLHDEPETRTEHTALLRKRFPHLSEAQRDGVLRHLTAEPDPTERRRSLESWLERSVSVEELEQDLRRRKFNELRTLNGVLPLEHQNQLDALAKEFEAEDTASFPMAGWGERSPRSADQLLELSDEDLLAYVRDVRLGHEPFGPSMEGLGDSLADAASREPDRLSQVVEGFIGADPSVVSGVLRGLEFAARAKKTIAWRPVLRLCRWVADQPREIPGRKTRYSDLDPGWGWTRRQIASLLLQALQDQPGGVEFDLRDELWPIIAILLTDPDPEPARTRADDPLTTAMNSVRGEAIRAVMAYGLFVRRALPDANSFEKMPEVQAALEAHLDPTLEASPAIRAVYGELLAVLYHLDAEWLRQNLKRVFPEDSTLADLRRGAWDSYVRYRDPLVPMLPELEPEYRKAIGETARETEADKKPESTARRLAEHVMRLAWQGNASLEDPDGLVAMLFRGAPLPLRAHAIEFVGRSLANTDGPIPQDALARLIRLWEQRVEFSRSASVEQVREELAAFGWWFGSKKFEQAWALAQLQYVLDMVGQVAWEHQVIETLAAWSESHASACVVCLDLILQRERERWGLELSLTAIRRVLESALKWGDPVAQRRARDVVNRLSALGHHGFRDLLG